MTHDEQSEKAMVDNVNVTSELNSLSLRVTKSNFPSTDGIFS